MDVQDEKTQTLVEDESHILERVARSVSSIRGPRHDYAHLAAELEAVLPFDLFGIVLVRHDGEAVRITTCRRENNQWTAHYQQHPLTDSMMERLARERTAQAAWGEEGASEASHESPMLLVQCFPTGVMGLPVECGDALCDHPWVKATLIAPLIAGGKMLGTLELGSEHVDAYADLALQRRASALASLLATAIEGVVAGGNVEIQNRQRAELKDVSAALTTAVDLPMILQRIVLGITNALHVSSAIVRFDQGQHCLHLEAHSGLNFDPDILQRLLCLKQALSEQAIIGAALVRHVPQVSQDISNDDQYPQSHRFASELGIRSFYCYPLITGRFVYGALLLLSSEPGGFTPLKTDIFALFAGQATVAIHNGMLLQSAQERRRFQEIIEQLEQVYQQNALFEEDDVSEAELFKRLRTSMMDTFGLSLSSVLHFLSEHLLTHSEGQLQEILRTAQGMAAAEQLAGELVESAPLGVAPGHELFRVSDGEAGTMFLQQAAEDALDSTHVLSEISAALLRALPVDEAYPQAYEQFRRDLAEPWVIVDLEGRCLYLNRAAQLFCGAHADREQMQTWQRWSEESSPQFGSFRAFAPCQNLSLTLEQAFAPILPRIREEQEVRRYLRAIESAVEGGEIPISLRCTLAAGTVTGVEGHRLGRHERAASNGLVHVQEATESQAHSAAARSPNAPSMLLDSAPSDRHYQFIRHTLYNEYGQCFAYALHVHDVTEQVRDEKNKAVLLASVSHDLRTPLTAIKAAVTGLLEPDMVWDEQLRREMLEDINAEADHLTTLVNSLVEMSQIEMGALVLDKEWCDIAEVVHTTLSRCQRLLADFTVVPEIQAPLPLVLADYVQLGRVLRNVFENVARYSTRRTRLRISVDVPGLQTPPLPEALASGVRVRIIDQGPGIPVEERERIFKSFYSLAPQGNGLGLAICRGIVEAHQGRIWVEAAAGGGSCFVFVLPITS